MCLCRIYAPQQRGAHRNPQQWVSMNDQWIHGHLTTEADRICPTYMVYIHLGCTLWPTETRLKSLSISAIRIAGCLHTRVHAIPSSGTMPPVWSTTGILPPEHCTRKYANRRGSLNNSMCHLCCWVGGISSNLHDLTAAVLYSWRGGWQPWAGKGALQSTLSE